MVSSTGALTLSQSAEAFRGGWRRLYRARDGVGLGPAGRRGDGDRVPRPYRADHGSRSRRRHVQDPAESRG